MSEPIPLTWFDLINRSTILLYDESISQGAVSSLDFIGDRVYASASLGRGSVVIKNENPIGPGSATPAYITTHGSFTTAVNEDNVILEHTVDDSHNISLVSGTYFSPDFTGIYAVTLNVWGEVTSDICNSDPIFDPDQDRETAAFYYAFSPLRYNFDTPVSSTAILPNKITYANCFTQNKMVMDAMGLIFINIVSGHNIRVIGSISPSPPDAPSSAGEFTFTMQRVSLGS